MFTASIPGQPIPQARARIAASGHHIMAPESRRWREVAVLIMRHARVGREPLDVLCRAEVTAIVARPLRRPERVPVDVWGAGLRTWAGNSADVDNYAKAALDAAQDAGWLTRDHLVAELVVRKVYAAAAEAPCLEIRMEAL